jgi:hypothetical protein
LPKVVIFVSKFLSEANSWYSPPVMGVIILGDDCSLIFQGFPEGVS